MKKKRIIFCAYNLDVGGIETSLVNLLCNLDYEKYDVTLFLTKKEGVFLNKVPENVKIIDFNVCESKNILFRKIVNFLKLNYFKIRYKNKYDFSAAYATTIKACTKLAYHFSSNNAIWVHGDFSFHYPNDKDLKNFIDYINIRKYKKIVFVSNSSKENLLKRGYNFNAKTYVFNNFIDYKQIEKMSQKERIKKTKTTFINVGRQKDDEKNLFMMLNVINRLVKENYKFELWMIGDGPDHEAYKNYVTKNNLDGVVKFLGKKKNPFVYYKVADAILLSSHAEGNPVVFMEAKVLGVPIITTEVSDAIKDIKNKYGIVTKKTENDYYNGIKEFLDKGFKMKKFDPQKYNDEVLEKLYDVIDR